MAGFHVPWTEISKFFLTSHTSFLFILDNMEITSVSEKNTRGHRMSKIVKSKQSCSHGHLPYHCSFWHLASALNAWRGMWICVRSKDTQKQLAWTSLKTTTPLTPLRIMACVSDDSHKAHLDTLMISQCQGNDTFVAFQEKWPLYFSQFPLPTHSSVSRWYETKLSECTFRLWQRDVLNLVLISIFTPHLV